MYYKGHFINVILSDDSGDVPGSVWHNVDDSYTIFINPNLSYERQKEVFEHELRHITENDFEKFDVQHIEAFSHAV